MSDVLERLRAENPVQSGSPPSFEEVWQRLDRKPSGPRRFRQRLRGPLAVALGVAPVVAVTVIILGLGQKSEPATRAGARSGSFVVHYVARTVFRPAASSGASFAYEVISANVWVAGLSAHRSESDSFYSSNGRIAGSPLRHEMATDGHLLENFQSSSLNGPGDITTSLAPRRPRTRCPLIVDCASQVSVDPVAEVRHLYNAGALVLVARDTRLNGRQVKEFRTTDSKSTVEIFVDAKTLIPVEIHAQYGPKPWPAYAAEVTTISDYQRLPVTRSNRALLRMRPHPGARPLCAGHGGGAPVGQGSPDTCVTPSSRPSTTALPPLPGHLVGQINLTTPDSRRAPDGIAYIYRKGKRYLIRVEARGIGPNRRRTAYAVWLAGGSNKARLLGFVTPGARNNEKLSTEGVLPANAAQFRHVLLTLEHTSTPHHPGMVVLEGTLPSRRY